MADALSRYPNEGAPSEPQGTMWNVSDIDKHDGLCTIVNSEAFWYNFYAFKISGMKAESDAGNGHV